MNEILEAKAKELISKNPKFFTQYDDTKNLIISMCESLSSVSFFSPNFYNEDDETKNELFNLFMCLYYHDNKTLNRAFANKKNNKTKNIEVYKDTLRTINVLLYNITIIDTYIYDDIIMICNAITKELYKSTYEEFLTNYIKG